MISPTLNIGGDISPVPLPLTPMVSWPISSNFGENLLFKCVSPTEIAKNSRKHYILGVQGRSSLSSMLVTPKSSSPVFVTISSKSVYLQHSHARLVDSMENGVRKFDAIVRRTP